MEWNFEKYRKKVHSILASWIKKSYSEDRARGRQFSKQKLSWQ